MILRFRTQLLLGYAILFALIIIGAVITIRDVNELLETDRWVAHTHKVIGDARHAMKSLLDMETGMRGYLLTGSELFLEPFDLGLSEYESTHRALLETVGDNPAQVEHLQAIHGLYGEWRAEVVNPAIQARQSGDFSGLEIDAIQMILQESGGTRLLGEIRQSIARLDSRLLAEGNEEGRIYAQAILTDMIDMESGKRGYLITGEESYLEPMEATKRRLADHFERLRQWVEEPSEASVDELDELCRLWVEGANRSVIEKRRSMSAELIEMKRIRALLRSGAGKNLMDAMRVEFDAFIAEEEGLLATRIAHANATGQRTVLSAVIGSILAMILGLIAMFYSNRSLLRQVGGEPSEIAAVAQQVAAGQLDVSFPEGSEASTGILASVREMVQALRTNAEETRRSDWTKTGLTRLNDLTRQGVDLSELCHAVIAEICEYLGAQLGAVYMYSEDGPQGAGLFLRGSYAYQQRKNVSNIFKLGEGLVGQAGLEKIQISISNIPEDYIKISSGLGESLPNHVSVTPFLFMKKLKGVVEIAAFREFSEVQLDYIREAMEGIGIAVDRLQKVEALEQALADSEAQALVLQEKGEALKVSNEELEEQTQQLRRSEEELRTQQEELKTSNEELEEQTQRLKQSEEELKVSNEELRQNTLLLQEQKAGVEVAREALELKAEELALASRYKSEFLANMSHELRTPLNSLLILSQSLAENEEETLTPDQVESAKVIYGAGVDLLNLINEILDLSKIEAGRMTVRQEAVDLKSFNGTLESQFWPLAEQKNLALKFEIVPGTPEAITSDRVRVEQVLKNLVSNAIKFTDTGSVEVRLRPASAEDDLSRSRLDPGNCIAIEVADTGVGIPEESLETIFDAFQQVDGSSSRPQTGTGLGLSISRELAHLLGGEIQLRSGLGKGSTFTLFLPIHEARTPDPLSSKMRTIKPQSQARIPAVLPLSPTDDDRESIKPGDQVMLIIEDDPAFAKILTTRCREKGMKTVVCNTAEEGIDLATALEPQGIFLDIGLPGIDGWSTLAILKENDATRHIPVHVISGEQATMDFLRKGAIGHLTKPVAKKDLDEAFKKLEGTIAKAVKDLLVVEDNAVMRKVIVDLIGNGDVHTTVATSGEEALARLAEKSFDCVILDIGLPDIDGFELLEKMQAQAGVASPPVIVYTGRDLTEEEEEKLRPHAESIIIKGVKSKERLLDEASLFLHRIVSRLPDRKRKMIAELHNRDGMFEGKHVLVVDDDMRNVYALSEILKGKGFVVHKAENGIRALEVLKELESVDIILMDVMMPKMDGYETIRRIREDEQYGKTPVLALTAKAMPQDRLKCIEAGASDYLTKPVDVDRLLSMMRVWLYR
jgi:CheY-like chemotaxis protein/CHASE3 domain sensor protein/GAF domain-containing protein